MKRLLTNISLFLVASVLFIILGPVGLLYGILTRFKFGLSAFFKSLAISIDQLGNVFAQYLFDDIMITKDGYSFGEEDETISHVLGVNQKDGTLKRCGKILCCILGKIDPDHCEKSI